MSINNIEKIWIQTPPIAQISGRITLLKFDNSPWITSSFSSRVTNKKKIDIKKSLIQSSKDMFLLMPIIGKLIGNLIAKRFS